MAEHDQTQSFQEQFDTARVKLADWLQRRGLWFGYEFSPRFYCKWRNNFRIRTEANPVILDTLKDQYSLKLDGGLIVVQRDYYFLYPPTCKYSTENMARYTYWLTKSGENLVEPAIISIKEEERWQHPWRAEKTTQRMTNPYWRFADMVKELTKSHEPFSSKLGWLAERTGLDWTLRI